LHFEKPNQNLENKSQTSFLSGFFLFNFKDRAILPKKRRFVKSFFEKSKVARAAR